jgi:hypothetical protein
MKVMGTPAAIISGIKPGRLVARNADPKPKGESKGSPTQGQNDDIDHMLLDMLKLS